MTSLLRTQRILFVALCIGAFPALAQTVPPSAQPDLQQRRITETPRTPMPATGAPALPPVQAAPANGTGRCFTLSSVTIEGSTIYSDKSFGQLYGDRVGKQFCVADAQNLAATISEQYRSDGYALSQVVVPAQDFAGGRVRLRAIEGFVGDVVINGDTGARYARDVVRQYAERLKAEKPLRIATLERYLLLMNDLPGTSANAVVKPSADKFGAADVIVNIGVKRYEGSLTADNRGTKPLGPWQYMADVAANSLLGFQERTLLRFVTTSPISEMRYYEIQHEEQIGGNGTKLVLDASHTRSEPRDIVAPLDIHGDTNFYMARLKHPFIRSRRENLEGRLQFDVRDTDTDLLGFNFTDDRLRVVRVGGTYDFVDPMDAVTQLDVQLSQGLNIFDATDTAGLSRSRADADATFTKINADVTRVHQLPANFSLLLAVSGQYSFDPLLAAEEFTLGGIAFGSAYDPSELVGDHGVGAKAELRYSQQTGMRFLESYQAFAYYDIGAIWQKNAPAFVKSRQSLASAGLGVRANFNPWLSGTAEVGFPLTRDVALEGDKDPRYFVSLTGHF